MTSVPRAPRAVGLLRLYDEFLPYVTKAAGPPTKDELPLDACWSASRGSLNSR